MAASINDVKDKSFDYIICGGGTSGLTLAARLTEDPNTTVLVLEAGNANLNDKGILLSGQFGSHLGNPAYSWSHNTIKQKSTGDTAHEWGRGKGLGGSSAINFLCWSKPTVEDVDDFERLGNPGWNWKNFEKYIQRTEGFVPPTNDVKLRKGVKLDSLNMGTKGPLTISYPPTIEDGELKVQETFVNAGFSLAARPMNGQIEGLYFGPMNYDPKTHTRTYAATAFYLPNKDRPNFTVLVGAHVNRVVPVSGSDSEFIAESVEFEHGGKIYLARANEEVILSAGTLKSPQILELSGIGNPNILRRMGIPAKVDLPGVGTNVQEHMIVGVSFELRDDVKFDTLDLLTDPEIAAKHLKLHEKGEGLYTSGIVGFCFATLDKVTPRANEIFKAAEEKIQKNANNYPPGLLEQYRISLERLKNGVGCEFISIPGINSLPNPPEKGKRYISFYVALNHTFSRGTIHATSKDPSVDPAFDPRYFDEDVDLQVWVEMVKFTRNLRNISPLKDMTTKELNPGPEVQTDEQIVEWIKRVMSTTWHTIGSCSMLPKANGGVVDPHLKVYGTKNLRVADLSVIPLHFAAHTQTTAYVVGEQAADIVKGKFQL